MEVTMSPYLGEIRIFLKSNIPNGFSMCNGQELFIHEYPRLYMIIGSQFGGDDKVKFQLPSMNNDTRSMIVYCIATEGKNESIR